MFDEALSACVDRAISRLIHRCLAAPASKAAIVEFTARLSSTGRARDYFDGQRAVMLLLPWWLERQIRPVPDVNFQELLVESSVNAYYFVRIIDDVMDENSPT